VCDVCACKCVLCVRDIYIQRCRHAPKLNKHEKILDVACVNVCLCCVCVTCTYSCVDMHPSIRTYIYGCKMPMYAEVWNIMETQMYLFVFSVLI